MISINKLWIFFLSLILIGFLNSSAPMGGAFSFAQEYPAEDINWDWLDLEEGDLLLRRGSTFVSTLISRAFPAADGMSHCGIVIKERDKWRIIHSISGSISDQDGIRIDDLGSFVAKAHQGKLYHVKPEFKVKRERLVSAAYYYLAQKAAFDHEFDLEDRSRLYCSELVRAVYLDAGVEDVFKYKKVAGKALVDMGSFFEDELWQRFPLQQPAP